MRKNEMCPNYYQLTMTASTGITLNMDTSTISTVRNGTNGGVSFLGIIGNYADETYDVAVQGTPPATGTNLIYSKISDETSGNAKLINSSFVQSNTDGTQTFNYRLSPDPLLSPDDVLFLQEFRPQSMDTYKTRQINFL